MLSALAGFKSRFVGVAAAAMLMGAIACQSGAGRDGKYPRSRETYDDRFASLLGVEDRGAYRKAMSEYREMVDDTSLAPRDRIRALLRLARCLEESNEKSKCRTAYLQVISLPGIQPDETGLPQPNELDIHFRLQAEAGLRRTGSAPVRLYSELARTGDPAQRYMAVRSLGRLADPGSRPVLRGIAGDKAEQQTIREAAEAALTALDRRR